MALDFTELDAIVAGSPGASIDSDFFAELKTNLQAVEAAFGEIGDDTFAGMAGTAVTITDLGTTDYHVSITIKGIPDGSVGEIGVVYDSGTQFTVYNTGGAGKAFTWRASL